MKLRIKDNTLRLRLSQSEVAQMAEKHFCTGKTAFLGGKVLTYSLKALPEAKEIHATFRDEAIVVYVPIDQVMGWTVSEVVGMEATQQVEDGKSLKILIEKDFQCLHREGEEELDNFPNPQK